MDEQWRPIPGYENHYSVSNLGRIRRDHTNTHAKAGHIMKLTTSRDGYENVGLSMNGNPTLKRVHRLVWEAFNGPIPVGHVINHKDGIKHHNTISNLEAVTHQTNILHAFRELGRRRPGEKITTAIAEQIRNRRAGGEPLKSIAASFGVTLVCVSSVVTGKTWAHAPGPIIPARGLIRKNHEVLSRIGPDVVASIIQRHRAGAGTAALAREFNVTKRTILNWVQGKTRHHDPQ